MRCLRKNTHAQAQAVTTRVRTSAIVEPDMIITRLWRFYITERNKMVGQIILITYLVLSSTLGAWWMANIRKGKKLDITLMDVAASILPAILFGWLYVFVQLDKVVLKKGKGSRTKKKTKNRITIIPRVG